jgi:hypothetical protein
MTDIIGCGTSDHNDECLCDVVITHPSGWVNDAVQDMWMGQEITRLMDYAPANQWDDKSILDYLCDLVHAKDNWRKPVDLPPKRRLVITRKLGGHKYVPGAWTADRRESLMEFMLNMETPSIVDAIQQLGMSHSDLMNVMFQSKRNIPMDIVVSFEKDILSKEYPTPYALGKKYGLPFQSVKKLAKYWGVKFDKYEDKRAPHMVIMDELIKTRPDLDNKQIASIINEQFNLDPPLKSTKVSHRRHVLKSK